MIFTIKGVGNSQAVSRICIWPFGQQHANRSTYFTVTPCKQAAKITALQVSARNTAKLTTQRSFSTQMDTTSKWYVMNPQGNAQLLGLSVS